MTIASVIALPRIYQNKASKSQSPALDSTSNWKVYANKKYGYEVKYPGGEVSASMQPGENIPIREARDVIIGIGDGAGTFWIRVQDNPSKLSASQYVEKVLQDYGDNVVKNISQMPLKIYQKGELTVNHLPAYYMDFWAGDRTERKVYISQDDKVYEISFPTAENPNDPDADKHSADYELMLSTFKISK